MLASYKGYDIPSSTPSLVHYIDNRELFEIQPEAHAV